MEESSPLIRERQGKLEKLRRMGIDPYGLRWEVTALAGDLQQHYRNHTAAFFDSEAVAVSLAGRLMTLRDHGKTTFADLKDRTGQIQIYLREDRLGNEAYNLLKWTDIGDFLGVTGRLFRTRTGELTVAAVEFRLLTKSLRPLPEKWHGLVDVETRYRQRYLDLVANPEVATVFHRRSLLIREVRQFFDQRGFLEVETPMMQPVAGGAAARPFITHHNALDMDLYLRIAPELYLKRLLVGGLERVYEINRNFRNEGIDTRHNPEFTMLEFYQAYADYHDLMPLTEELLPHLCRVLLGGEELTYQGVRINLSPPWPRLTVVEALRKVGGIPEEDLEGAERLRAVAAHRGIPVQAGWGWGKLVDALMAHLVEPHLVQPTFLLDFPLELSPLARSQPDDPRLAQRFELFVAGLELANAYTELNDPQEQRQRLEEQLRAREGGDEEAHRMDEDFVRALEYGMPPAAGEGIGIDRLVMLFTDSPSIRDVILFPQLRPKEQG
ncbi:MAG TPA: lysine--tRNA ligase [Candidatus Methylomirabilis sp.]